MITIGDLCSIKSLDNVKADAFDIVEKWHNDFKSEYTDTVYNFYKPGKAPEEHDAAFNYTVEGIVNQDGTLYAICHAHGVETVYVTTLDNLSSFVRPRRPFEIGKMATITDTLKVYSSWSTFMDSLDGQIENYQDVRSRWVDGRTPDRGGIYKVVYIGLHAARPAAGTVVVIDDGSKVFIMGAEGLAKTYAWDEYRQYLRNWAAKYTEYSPSHSPKTYEQWVQARNGNM